MNRNVKNLFLIDSLGALLSAFLLGVMLVRFESAIGMPRAILYFLSLLAFLLALSSGTNYWLAGEKGASFLKLTAYANILYCCLTAGLLFFFRGVVTHWGLLYFVAEMGVVAVLIYVELKTAIAHSN